MATGSPDRLGVLRCEACGIEFRPTQRVPIRRAGLSPAEPPPPAHQRAIFLVVLVAALLGVAVAFGEREAAQNRIANGVEVFPPAPPPLELDLDLDLALAANPLAPMALTHAVHLSQRTGAELFMTGVVVGHELEPLDHVNVEVAWRDAGGQGSTLPAVVACPTLAPRETCAWMLDAALPGQAVELEVRARGQRPLGLWEQLDLRSDRPGELDFDPVAGEVRLTLVGPTVLSAWATVTAYGEGDRVLGVGRSEWPALHAGAHTLAIAAPRPADEVARYLVRVGGDRPVGLAGAPLP